MCYSKGILATYPPEVGQMLKSMRIPLYSEQKTKHVIDNVLSEKLGHMALITKYLVINVQLIDTEHAVTSNVITPCIDISSPIWYKQLCEAYNTTCFYIITPDGRKMINLANREDFAYGTLVYGPLKEKEPLKSTATIHLFHKEDKHTVIHAVFSRAFGALTKTVVEKVINMEKKEFAQFVTNESGTFLTKTMVSIFKSIDVYGDGSTKSMTEFNTRYIAEHSKQALIRLESFLMSHVIHSIRFIFYFAKVKLLNYIAGIHEFHKRKHMELPMSHLEFGKFWEIEINGLLNKVLGRFTNDSLLKVLKTDTFHDMEKLFGDIFPGITKEQKMNTSVYEDDDKYNHYYDGIKIPVHYGWLSGDKTIPSLNVLLSSLGTNGTLFLDGKRKENKENDSVPIVIFKKKDQDLHDTYKVTKDTSMIINCENEPTLILEHDTGDAEKRLLLGLISRSWWYMDGKNIKKALTSVDEVADKSNHYIFEK